MSAMSNWIWILVAVAAAGHALRWVPGRATYRQVKIPAMFALLYVVYAAALGRGGLVALVLSFLIVEVILQLVKRRRPPEPESPWTRRR
jgi:uncharacterized membrane protein